jgi:ferredoxin
VGYTGFFNPPAEFFFPSVIISDTVWPCGKPRVVWGQRMKVPVVDYGMCTLCEGCIEVCPEVFRLNDAGYIEVIELAHYPEEEVEEAIKYCPEDCITWEER